MDSTLYVDTSVEMGLTTPLIPEGIHPLDQMDDIPRRLCQPWFYHHDTTIIPTILRRVEEHFDLSRTGMSESRLGMNSSFVVPSHWVTDFEAKCRLAHHEVTKHLNIHLLELRALDAKVHRREENARPGKDYLRAVHDRIRSDVVNRLRRHRVKDSAEKALQKLESYQFRLRDNKRMLETLSSQGYLSPTREVL